MSRSVSSAAEDSAARSSSGERPSARASSSSVRRIARGVRSSWLASATNARSCSSASPSRSSISFSVVPSRATSSSGRWHRKAPVGLGGGDLSRARAHRLDRVKGGRGDAVGGQRGEDQGHRAAHQQELRQVRERLAACLGRGADDDDPLLPPGADRHRQQARLVLQAGQRAAVEDDRAAQRPVPAPRARAAHGLPRPARSPRRGRRSRAPRRSSRVRPTRVLLALAQPGVGLLDQGGDVARPRSQPGVDRAVELGAEAQVDEDAGGAEDEGHHGGEGEGDAEADREVAQRPPSFRSR